MFCFHLLKIQIMILRNTEGGKERADFMFSLLGNATNAGAMMPGLPKGSSRRNCRVRQMKHLILGAHFKGVPKILVIPMTEVLGTPLSVVP